MSDLLTLPSCPDCGCRLSVSETVHARGGTYRKLVCKCGSRFESEEMIVRRLPPVAAHARPPIPVGTGGHPPAPVVAGTPADGRGVGGVLPVGPISQASDPNPGSPGNPKRARARSKTPAEYPTAFDAEWNKTAKTGAKGDAFRAWDRLGRPAFGDSWKRWEACHEWRQDWYHYPHVSSWLNDGRYHQDPAETRAKPVTPRNGVPVETFDARRNREREESSERESERLIWGTR